MQKRLLSPSLILPTTIFFGVLLLGLRSGDVWERASSGRLLTPALAEPESKPAASAPAAPDASKAGAADAIAPDTVAPADADVDWPQAAVLVKQLTARRDELDKRARNLDQREALVKVAEQRVDEKIKELEQLRLQLQAMVNQADATQEAQLENLVKIYETMKPSDAAKIFENLDMPVLLDVIQKMKPKSTAPILAAMAPEKAKEVTVALTKQNQLPAVK